MFERSCGEKGQALVEYALVLPLLLLLVFGIIDLGIAVFSYDTIANAAREGVRYGIIDPHNAAEIELRTRRLTSGLDPSRLVFSCPTCAEAAPRTVRVELTYQVRLITGPVIRAVGGNPFMDLRAGATMQVED